MKKIIFLLPVILCLVMPIFLNINVNANDKQTMNTQTEKIRTLYNNMYEFMINKDILSLGKMLDEKFVLVHMTGLKQNKKEYLNSIKNGTLNYYSNETENIIVKNSLNFI